ncbi:MAG: hypothetical protein NT129_00185 [Candidatus Aenigmarchaeota archaeon]|nr:hypothetical protein [Candidatus Aenigmarchaeota archaeon]
MKGIVNIEFVLSVIVFITTITFVTMTIVNNIPFLHRESISEHVKSKAYQISDILLFDEGYPSNWNENTVARLGLSSGKSYELSTQKITDLNDSCALNPNRTKELFGELGIYVDINITKIDSGHELTPNCTTGKRGLIFTATRFAVIVPGNDIVKVDVSIITK